MTMSDEHLQNLMDDSDKDYDAELNRQDSERQKSDQKTIENKVGKKKPKAAKLKKTIEK